MTTLSVRKRYMTFRDRIKQNKSQWKGALRATQKWEEVYTEFQYYRIGYFTGIDQFQVIWFRSVPFHTTI